MKGWLVFNIIIIFIPGFAAMADAETASIIAAQLGSHEYAAHGAHTETDLSTGSINSLSADNKVVLLHPTDTADSFSDVSDSNEARVPNPLSLEQLNHFIKTIIRSSVHIRSRMTDAQSFRQGRKSLKMVERLQAIHSHPSIVR